MEGLVDPKPRHANPKATHTSVAVTKQEMELIRVATAKHNRLYGTNISVKDFVREAVAQKIARLEDEED